MTMKLLFAILALLSAAQNSTAKEWHGIVPLKSTRVEIERRFGKPDKWGEYQVNDERVSFEYSDGPCADLYRGLHEDNCHCLLEDGTVISISVEPTVERKVSALKLDMTQFKRTPINPFPNTFEYSNRTEGINYTVNEPEDKIITIGYYAAQVDCQNIIKMRSPAYRNSWRGLIPLHATRRQVERLLGAPQRTWETNAAYETDHETLMVKYAKGGCGVGNTEWNVPRDTVVEIEVGQRFSFLLSQLNLDSSRWERQEIFPFPETANPPKVVNYKNPSDGISIRAQSKSGGEEVVVSIAYKPASKDEQLRCHSNDNGAKAKP
jgi:hypothetical protein